LSLASAADRALGRRVLGAVLAGAVLVALAGIGVYLVRHGRAVQAATTQNPVRFRGIGQNPNTVAMLLAVALPLAALLGLEARTWARRLAAALFAIGVGITRIPDPLSPNDPQAHKSASAYAAPYNAHDAERFWRLEDDVGRPAGGSYRPPKHRTLFGGSGRIDAWRAGFHQG